MDTRFVFKLDFLSFTSWKKRGRWWRDLLFVTPRYYWVRRKEVLRQTDRQDRQTDRQRQRQTDKVKSFEKKNPKKRNRLTNRSLSYIKEITIYFLPGFKIKGVSLYIFARLCYPCNYVSFRRGSRWIVRQDKRCVIKISNMTIPTNDNTKL